MVSYMAILMALQLLGMDIGLCRSDFASCQYCPIGGYFAVASIVEIYTSKPGKVWVGGVIVVEVVPSEDGRACSKQSGLYKCSWLVTSARTQIVALCMYGFVCPGSIYCLPICGKHFEWKTKKIFATPSRNSPSEIRHLIQGSDGFLIRLLCRLIRITFKHKNYKFWKYFFNRRKYIENNITVFTIEI